MPSPEQDEIAATTAAFVAAHHRLVGPQDGAGLDADTWRQCAELGWLGLGLDEGSGGVGYGLAEEVFLFRELGRGAMPGAFLPGVLGARLAAAAGDGDLARAVVAGEVRVALGTPAGPAAIGSEVTGELSVAHTAGAELVVVCDAGGAALIRVADCALVPIDAVEWSVPSARGRATAATSVAHAPSDAAPIFLRGLVLAAAEATGVAEAALAAGVLHAKERVQFGRPIGVNQGIKHRCADMALRAEGALAQTCYAALAVDGTLADADREAFSAKYVADEAARLNTESCIQIHGALGFTIEAAPHRFVYRAHALGRCLASRAQLLDAIIGARTAPAS